MVSLLHRATIITGSVFADWIELGMTHYVSSSWTLINTDTWEYAVVIDRMFNSFNVCVTVESSQ